MPASARAASRSATRRARSSASAPPAQANGRAPGAPAAGPAPPRPNRPAPGAAAPAAGPGPAAPQRPSGSSTFLTEFGARIFQRRPQLAETARDPACDRPGRDVELLGDLPVALVAGEEPVEDLAAVGRERREPVANRQGAVELRDQLVDGAGARPPRPAARALLRGGGRCTSAGSAGRSTAGRRRRHAAAAAARTPSRTRPGTRPPRRAAGAGSPGRDRVDVAREALDEQVPRGLRRRRGSGRRERRRRSPRRRRSRHRRVRPRRPEAGRRDGFRGRHRLGAWPVTAAMKSSRSSASRRSVRRRRAPSPCAARRAAARSRRRSRRAELAACAPSIATSASPSATT